MGMTLEMLAEQLREAHLDDNDGVEIIVPGIQQLVDHAETPWNVLTSTFCPSQDTVSAFLKRLGEFAGPQSVDTCLVIALQHAYLQAFQRTLQNVARVLESRFDLDDVACEENWRTRLLVYCEQIRSFPLQVGHLDFRNLHNSPFVKEYLERFTEIWFKMRFFKQGHIAYDAYNLSRRISYLIYPAVLRNIAIDQAFYAPLIHYLQHLGFWDTSEIAKYEASVLSLPIESVFHETFVLRDMYVELQTASVIQPPQQVRYGTSPFWDGAILETGPRGQLMQILLDQLDDSEHVIFIQAPPGRGKSTFCTMLAAKVALGYPEWVPLLIRLRDAHFNPELPLENAIREYMRPYFPQVDDLLHKRRLLIILDGLDELHLPVESNQILRRFFQALSDFQARCARNNVYRHKVVLTGRPVKIQDIESNLPGNFLRFSIEPIENPQLVPWLSNWETVAGSQSATAFQAFLEQGEVFNEGDSQAPSPLKQLTGNPLLLYLLGVLHKHHLLQSADLPGLSSSVEIYNRIVSWICGEFSPMTPPTRDQQRLAAHGISPKTIRRILQEMAICIWHEQRTAVPIAHIQTYLSSAVPRSAKRLMSSGLRGIHNPLISFPFDAQDSKGQTVGFSHKSFGEYLAAEKMVLSVRQISESFAGHVDLESPALQEAAHRFYSVFGVTLLTDEIWEFMMDILCTRSQPEELVKMTERLYRLYITYSNGRWIDEDIARTQWGVLKRYDMTLNLLQFEAQAGINLFALLGLLYWKTGGIFDICGREAEGTFDPDRFRKLLALGELVGTFGLFRRISHLLSRVNLRGANLLCVNFRRANLQGADLHSAVLRDANLRGTNFQDACLENTDLRMTSLQNAQLVQANLRGANLEDADLRGANFKTANLEKVNLLCAEMRDAEFVGANLKEAVLYGTMMQGADFSGADFSGAIISQQHLQRNKDLFTDAQIAQFHIVHD